MSFSGWQWVVDLSTGTAGGQLRNPQNKSCHATCLALDWQSTSRVEDGSLPGPHLFSATHSVLSSNFVWQVLMGIAAQPPAGKTAPERWISFCKASVNLVLQLQWSIAEVLPVTALLCNTCAAHLSACHFIGGALLDVWHRWALASLMWTASGCTTRSRCGSLSDGSTAWAQQHWMPLPPLGLP